MRFDKGTPGWDLLVSRWAHDTHPSWWCVLCDTTDNPCTENAKMLIPLRAWPSLQWELPHPRLCAFPGGGHIHWLVWSNQRSIHVAQFRTTLEGHSGSRAPHEAGQNLHWYSSASLSVLSCCLDFFSSVPKYTSYKPNACKLSQGVCFSREAKLRHLTFHMLLSSNL